MNGVFEKDHTLLTSNDISGLFYLYMEYDKQGLMQYMQKAESFLPIGIEEQLERKQYYVELAFLYLIKNKVKKAISIVRNKSESG